MISSFFFFLPSLLSFTLLFLLALSLTFCFHLCCIPFPSRFLPPLIFLTYSFYCYNTHYCPPIFLLVSLFQFFLSHPDPSFSIIRFPFSSALHFHLPLPSTSSFCYPASCLLPSFPSCSSLLCLLSIPGKRELIQ